MPRWIILLALPLLAVLFAMACWALLTRNPENLSLRELGRAAGESYVFAYPLLVMDQTRAAMLAAPETETRPGFAANRLSHIRHLPVYGDEAVVRPNRDTLYSIAWLDLSEGPVLLRWPEMGERYWLFQVLDAWTGVAGAPGARTLGAGPGAAMISGPGWDGPALPGMVHIQLNSDMAWIIGRIEVAQDASDLQAVRTLQDSLSLTGPQAAEAPATPPALGRRPPEVIAALSAADVFERLSRLIVENPPREVDSAMDAHLRALGVEPGARSSEGFGWVAQWVIGRGVQIARARLLEGISDRPYGPTGWRTLRSGIGDYGTDYALRAGVAMIGLGANLPEDAIYPTTDLDAHGEALTGDRAYQIRFGPDALPPAAAFWSITAYDADGFLLNSERHAVTDRDTLVYDDDGGLTLTIGAAAQDAGRVANHLPVTPGAPFQLTARLYLPEGAALSGAWEMPPVERLD